MTEGPAHRAAPARTRLGSPLRPGGGFVVADPAEPPFWRYARTPAPDRRLAHSRGAWVAAGGAHIRCGIRARTGPASVIAIVTFLAGAQAGPASRRFEEKPAEAGQASWASASLAVDPRAASDSARVSAAGIEVRDRVVKSLVGIRVGRPEPKLSFKGRFRVTAEISPTEGTGTGIVVDPSGLVLTCAHVVGLERWVRVTLPDDREVAGVVVVADAASDLALLKIEAGTLIALDMRRAPRLRQGGSVYLASRPGGGPPRFEEGTLAAEGAFHAGHSDIEFLRQFLGQIEPGDSGGALVDEDGRFVGVISSGVPHGRVGYAHARELVLLALARLRAGPPVVWPWIGIGVESDPGTPGVRVWTVVPGSPAEAGGVRAGDRLVALDGHRLDHFLPAMMAVIARPVGTIFRLEIRRPGPAVTIAVPVVSAPRPLEPELPPFDVFEKLTGIRLGVEPAVTGAGAAHIVVVHDGAPKGGPQGSGAEAPRKEAPGKDRPGVSAPRRDPLERPPYGVGSRLVSVLPGVGVVLTLEEGKSNREIPITTAADLAQALRGSTIGATTTAILVWWTAGRRETMLLSGEARRPPVL